MVGNKNSGQLGGNPNIRNIRKTGPKTVEGKLKGVLATGVLFKGTSSKLMKIVNKCNTCPLRPRRRKVIVKGKEIEIVTPATCRSYEKDRKICVYSMEEQIQKMKVYFEIQEKVGKKELQKAMIMQSLIDAEMARKVEVLSTGKPSSDTRDFSDLAMKYNSDLIKAEIPQRHQHLHLEGDLAKRMIDAIGLGKDDKDDKDDNDDNDDEE